MDYSVKVYKTEFKVGILCKQDTQEYILHDVHVDWQGQIRLKSLIVELLHV